jgi:hypothetical protein
VWWSGFQLKNNPDACIPPKPNQRTHPNQQNQLNQLNQLNQQNQQNQQNQPNP